MDDKFLEPLKAYGECYRDQFDKEVKQLFDSLVKRSKMDVAKNRATVKSFKQLTAIAQKLAAKSSSFKALRGFLIALAVLGGILFFVGIIGFVNKNYLVGGICLPLGLALLTISVAVIFAKLNKDIKNLDERRQKILIKADKLKSEGWAQMQPLNSLFDSDMTKKLIEKTVPLIKIDDNFNMRRYDYLNGKYGFGDNLSKTRSTIGILTGEIVGNPFVVERELVNTMGTKTYTGSLVIHWTTTYTDSDGNVHTQHHTQTLYASVTKPFPYYHEETRLIYGNEAAGELHFTHTPSHAERMDDDKVERTVKSGARKIRRHQKRVNKAGGNFTEMGNEEFDVLFGALDRDNEVQFRLLFTPLAQKNMLALMRSKVGYGDDFKFEKRGNINIVSSEHSKAWDLDLSASRFYSFDVDAAYAKFKDFNEKYFKSLYFDLAPLMSIPLYQQLKPSEYIYRHDYRRNCTNYEAEYAANVLGQSAFSHPRSATQSILKTSLVEKDGGSDVVNVTAYSYEGEDRVDFVSVFGGDGLFHSVPVYWTEYLPISNSRTIKIKDVGLSERNYRLSEIGGLLGKYGLSGSFSHGIVCYLAHNTSLAVDAEIDCAVKRSMDALNAASKLANEQNAQPPKEEQGTSSNEEKNDAEASNEGDKGDVQTSEENAAQALNESGTQTSSEHEAQAEEQSDSELESAANGGGNESGDDADFVQSGNNNADEESDAFDEQNMQNDDLHSKNDAKFAKQDNKNAEDGDKDQ